MSLPRDLIETANYLKCEKSVEEKKAMSETSDSEDEQKKLAHQIVAQYVKSLTGRYQTNNNQGFQASRYNQNYRKNR